MMSHKEMPPLPGSEYDTLRNLTKDDKTRNRATTSPSSSRAVYSSYHPTSSTQNLDSQRYMKPFSASQSHLLLKGEDTMEEMPGSGQVAQMSKNRKNSSVPRLTIKKPEDQPADREGYSAPPTTPGTSFASKFGRGRSKIKNSNQPSTPTLESAQPDFPETAAKFGSESGTSPQDRPSTRSSSSDGRITSKLKASKTALQQQQQKWSTKSLAAWGKLKGKSEPVKPIVTVPTKPGIEVFGMPLEDAIRLTRVVKTKDEDAYGYWLPAVVYRSVLFLDKYGPHEVGLYRVPGSTAAVDGLRDDFRNQHDVDLLQNRPNDIATVASMLKGYVRQLPDPILPTAVQKTIYDLCKDKTDSRTPPKAFVDELSRLSPSNYYTLKCITTHLSKINDNSNINKMTLSNLAMVFCSTLRIDRYIFNWLVGEPNHCWNGCLTAEDSDKSDKASDSNSVTVEIPEAIGLGIERQDSASAVSVTSASLEKKRANRSSRVLDLTLTTYNLQETDRGKKRGSQELGWSSPSGGRLRRGSLDSVNSLDTQAAFYAQTPHTPKQRSSPQDVYNAAAEATRNFKLDARARRSVDLNNLMSMGAQPANNNTYTLEQSVSRYNPVNSMASFTKSREQMPTQPRRTGSKPSVLENESPPTGKRKPSAERTPKSGTADLLPPMPPISPLMSGTQVNYPMI